MPTWNVLCLALEVRRRIPGAPIFQTEVDQERGGPGKIGGFFPLDLGSAPQDLVGRRSFVSVADRWFSGARRVDAFHNARSALAALCRASLKDGRLWLPSFICKEVATAGFEAVGFERIKYYPLARTGAAAPALDALDGNLRAGDAVLLADYFGRPPPPIARRPDVLWIEDRAQALWPGPSRCDAVLYSPRKLLGVPDGGYLVIASTKSVLHSGRASARPPSMPSFWPSLARFEDSSEADNAHWYAAFRAAEDAMDVSSASASRLSSELLQRIDFERVARRRRRNFATLRPFIAKKRSGPAINTPVVSRWVPQGYPVLVRDAGATSAALARNGIFCPVLWSEIPAPDACERARAIAGRVLLLPTDHRYGETEMQRVAAAFLEALGRERFEEI